MYKHTIVSAAGADAVEAQLKRRYGEVRLFGHEVALDEDTVADERFLVSRIRVSGSVAARTDIPVISAATATGTYRWAVGAERGEAAAAPFLLQPGAPVLAWLSDAEVDAVSFPLDTLEQTARATYADDGLRLRFDSSRPRSSSWARIHRNAVQFAVRNRRSLEVSEMVGSMVYRHLAACTLEAFALHGDPTSRRTSARARYDGFRRANAFIDDFASLPITIEDIAQAAGLSVSDLQGAFRAHSSHGGNAAEALQRVRLAAAHRDLVTADAPAGIAVREVALRWGFRPSRFLELHRRHYGFDPHGALDRADDGA
jgi:AraC-like DNA-binding protein